MLEFRILGPLEARLGGERLRLGGAKQRALLATLLLHANEVVSTERLIDELWGERPPETAANALQVYVSQLRKALAADETVVTRPPGYCVRVGPEQLDAERFEQMTAAARSELARGDAAAAADTLRSALSLWRGPPLADVVLESSAAAEAARLEELRQAALEDRIEADLALGRHAEVVPELEQLVAAHPLRERLLGQLMLALYRSGRQADALDAYRVARATLVGELGIDPAPELQELEHAILRHDLALAAPTGPPLESDQLPVAPTSLVGRERELAEATDLARREDVRLLTFTGPGGIGKTRLAVEVARALGVARFIDLTTISDPELLAPTIGAALGVAQRQGQSAADALEDYLRPRRFVLLLDNFEQLLDAAPLLTRVLAAARGVKLLVTSRAVLRLSGEHEFPVPPLQPSKALALFAERARAVAPGFTLDEEGALAVAEICERLDGLPLAIELAAARAKLLPPPAMLKRLGSRVDLLTAGARDAPERQRTLRATLDWSYELLEPEELRLFARLGVFVGGCGLEAVEAVCAGEGNVLEPLASLVDKSLVRQRGTGEPRFTMLEIIREYAGARLGESGEEPAVRRRHLDHYLPLAERAWPELEGPEEGIWLDRLELEHDNIRAALAFALGSVEGDEALRLVAALWRFWQIRGHLAEGRRALAAALDRTPGDPSGLRARALNGLGVLAAEQGDFESARVAFEQSLEAARGADKPHRVSAALGNLGTLDLYAGDYERARRLYEEAVALRREIGDLVGAVPTIENLGNVAFCQGDLDSAVEFYGEARRIADEAGARHGSLRALLGLVRTALVRDDLGEAAAGLREAIEIAREIGDRVGTAEILEASAALLAAGGDGLGAAELFGAADALRAAIGALRAPDQREWYATVRTGASSLVGDQTTFEAALGRGSRVPSDEALELTERITKANAFD